jgi:hypothetical protein
MTEKPRIDIGGMAIASIVAVLALLVAPGPYSIFSAVIAITLTVIVMAYGLSQPRPRVIQSIAFGMMLGLCLVPLFGFIDESWQFHGLPPEYDEATKGPTSRVQSFWLVILWLLTTAVFCAIDLWRRRAPKAEAPSPTRTAAEVDSRTVPVAVMKGEAEIRTPASVNAASDPETLRVIKEEK